MPEVTPEMHYFRYDVHELGPSLQRTSVSEFNDGIPALLERKQYSELGHGPKHIKTYASTITSDKYLIIVQVEQYRFIFYVPDDACLLAWRREYEQIPANFLPPKFLPPPRTAPEQIVIPMNMRALRG